MCYDTLMKICFKDWSQSILNHIMSIIVVFYVSRLRSDGESGVHLKRVVSTC